MLIFALASLMGLTLLIDPVQQDPDDRRPAQRFITVVGAGKATAKPDTAEIQAGVVTQAASAAEALRDNTAAMESLIKTLSARGIAEKDVQTSNFNVNPVYRHDPQGRAAPTVTGYQVTNQVRVKVRQIAALGPLLDELVKGGANQVHGISFTVAEPDAVQDRARESAVADARRRAELYARATGVKLGRVLRLQEQSPHVPGPGPTFMAMARSEAASVPVAPGEQEYRVDITVTYAID